jgi:glucose/mannose transport system substrate-binding protein
MLDLITVDGTIYSVPVNIHRSNLIWYNPAVLDEVGIDAPPATWEEFLQQADVFTQVLEHTDIDQAASDWQPAIDPIIEGDAAYNVSPCRSAHRTATPRSSGCDWRARRRARTPSTR